MLSNLPTASLRMREDQEEIERGEEFETPFSMKAKEDAKVAAGTAVAVGPLALRVVSARPNDHG